MLILLTCIFVWSFDADRDEMDANQFLGLMRGLHSCFHDVTFLYEGGSRAGKGASAAQMSPNEHEKDYQGRFVYRSDGAEFLEFSAQGLGADARQSRSLSQNLGGVATVTVIPDLNRLDIKPPPQKSISPPQSRPTHSVVPGLPASHLVSVVLFGTNRSPGSRL